MWQNLPQKKRGVSARIIHDLKGSPQGQIDDTPNPSAAYHVFMNAVIDLFPNVLMATQVHHARYSDPLE